jgi:ligand-binding sensor protein
MADPEASIGYTEPMNDSPAESMLLCDLLVNIDVDDLSRAIAFYLHVDALRARYRSRCTVSGLKAGRQTEMYSAPSGPGVL